VWFQMKEITKQGDGRGIPRKVSQRWTNTDKWRTPFGVKWFKQTPKYWRKQWRKEDAERQRPARTKETNKTISPGLRVGTRCWSGVFQFAKPCS
jgi:hypothetical protein